MTKNILALDIGGANLKAADGHGWCHTEPFAMWRFPQQLPEALRRIVALRDDCRRVVVTMTGEIADCFSSRRDGVTRIVAAVEEACCDRSVGVYLVDGTIVTTAEAVRRSAEAAASNWHALATYAAWLVRPARGLLVDVGSTTVDIVWLEEGQPRPRGRDDVSRMASGELVYTGIERTPLASIVHELPWRGRLHSIARERFADAQDAWVVLGLELAGAGDTADGRPLDRGSAVARLGRMLLLDPEDFTLADARAAAEFVATAQARLVAQQLKRVASAFAGRPDVIVLSGHGESLARRSLQQLDWSGCRVTSLQQEAGPDASRVGPAHALALIAAGRLC